MCRSDCRTCARAELASPHSPQMRSPFCGVRRRLARLHLRWLASLRGLRLHGLRLDRLRSARWRVGITSVLAARAAVAAAGGGVRVGSAGPVPGADGGGGLGDERRSDLAGLGRSRVRRSVLARRCHRAGAGRASGRPPGTWRLRPAGGADLVARVVGREADRVVGPVGEVLVDPRPGGPGGPPGLVVRRAVVVVRRPWWPPGGGPPGRGGGPPGPGVVRRLALVARRGVVARRVLVVRPVLDGGPPPVLGVRPGLGWSAGRSWGSAGAWWSAWSWGSACTWWPARSGRAAGRGVHRHLAGRRPGRSPGPPGVDVSTGLASPTSA